MDGFENNYYHSFNFSSQHNITRYIIIYKISNYYIITSRPAFETALGIASTPVPMFPFSKCIIVAVFLYYKCNSQFLFIYLFFN